MISVTSAQLDMWLATFLYPLVRLLALIASAPIFGDQQTPVRVKIGLSVLLAILLSPTLDPMPTVPVGSPQGLFIIIEQIIIGSAMGFTIRLIFSAVELAGEFSGMIMGIGFASFYDTRTAINSAVISQWLGIIASLTFLTLNGHLMILALVAESFHTLPIGQLMPVQSFYTVVQWGANIFIYGLQISLPLLAALLITNLALGILTRAAQQLNLFAIGFPITLTIGFVILNISLPYLAPIMDRMTADVLATSLKLVKLP